MALRIPRSLLPVLMAPVLAVWLAVTAGVASAVDASKTPVDIDFEQDTPGTYPPGFESADSSLLDFDRVDYAGTGDCDPPSTCAMPGGVTVNANRGTNDTQALTTQGIGVGWAIRINFLQPTQRVSLMIGDADVAPKAPEPPPIAVLTGFFKGTRLASVSVQGDDDSLADQLITLQGFVIDSAVIQWQNANGTPRAGWPEMVDNVHSDPLCSVFGDSAGNTLNGTPDIDVMCGGPGADTLNGFGDNDLMYGNNQGDTLNGGAGRDSMFGGAGTDTCNGSTGTDIGNSCEMRTSVP